MESTDDETKSDTRSALKVPAMRIAIKETNRATIESLRAERDAALAEVERLKATIEQLRELLPGGCGEPNCVCACKGTPPEHDDDCERCRMCRATAALALAATRAKFAVREDKP